MTWRKKESRDDWTLKRNPTKFVLGVESSECDRAECNQMRECQSASGSGGLTVGGLLPQPGVADDDDQPQRQCDANVHQLNDVQFDEDGCHAQQDQNQLDDKPRQKEKATSFVDTQQQ